MSILNKEIKEKWINALRSGEYTQGQGYLYIENSDGTESFCCLGVLEYICGTPKKDMKEIAMPAGLNERKSSTELEYTYEEDNDDYTTWEDKLASMNDLGNSFEAIAQFIEKEL